VDGGQLHLAINHLPIIGIMLGTVLVGVTLAWRRDPGLMLASAIILSLGGVGGVASYFSGEDAEHAVEERPGYDHDALETHEDSARFATVSGLAAAAPGGYVAFRALRGLPVGTRLLAGWLLVSLWASATMVRMGLTGRVVGHPGVYGEKSIDP